MTKDNDNGGYILSNGRRLYAAMGCIGIDESLSVVCGSDDGILVRDAGMVNVSEALTPEERREFADYVIALWNQWATGGGDPGTLPPA